MKSIFVFIIFTVLLAIQISGQIQRCSTPNPSQIVYSNSLYKVSGNISIPVFFHIVYSSTDNVTNSQLQDQIDELNSAFSSSRFSFYTQGITRTQNSAWRNFQRGSQTETDMTNALAVDPKHAFNVYVVELSSSILGWVIKWPWEVTEESLQNGVIINKGSLPGGNINDYNEGKTLVHEGGHYLGLYHTFQNGCTSPGDEVDDTPYHLVNYNCPSENTNTCSQAGNDPIHNYMNYTSDPCMYEFTSGQFSRIDEIVGEYKPNLGSEETPPSAPQNLTIAWYNNHPKLTWNTNTESDMQSYKIWKYVEGSSMIAATVTHNSSNTTHSWIDNDVEPAGKFDPIYTYYYKVKAVDYYNYESPYSNQVSISGTGGIWKKNSEENNNIDIKTYELYSSYPNPFNPATKISYQIPKDGFVNLIVYNTLGQEVAKLVNEHQSSGKYTVQFNASNLPSGVYIYKLQANDFSSVKKMMLTK